MIDVQTLWLKILTEPDTKFMKDFSTQRFCFLSNMELQLQLFCDKTFFSGKAKNENYREYKRCEKPSV